MPTYQYACSDCGHRFEAVQKFTDDSLTVCPVCGGLLRKVYGSVGVVFKGSGWYRTDSRGGPAVAAPAGGAKSEGSSDSKSTSSGSDSSSSSGSGSDGASKTASPSTPSSAPSTSGSSSSSAGTSSSGGSAGTSKS